MSAVGKKLLGKYRGVVVSNLDPENRGRIKVTVPSVFGENTSGYALPCTPLAAFGSGVCAIPPEGVSVWIEFEDGRPDRPVWSGCFWDTGETMPTGACIPDFQRVLVQTPMGNKLLLDDVTATAGVTIKTTAGHQIAMTPEGITISTATGQSLELTAMGITLQAGPAGPKLSLTEVGISLSTPEGGSVAIQGPMVSINNESLKVIG